MTWPFSAAAAFRACCAALALLGAAAGCRDTNVLTESYATLKEAIEDGAVERGWMPKGLPPGARDIREAHDLDSNRRWGLFNFPPQDADALRAILGSELSVAGRTCNPPRRIEWWPVLLREQLDQEQIAATGLRTYASRDGDLIVAVNWSQGRAYYWSGEQ